MGPSEPAAITAEVVKAVQCCRHMHGPFGVGWWEERSGVLGNRTRLARVPLGDSPIAKDPPQAKTRQNIPP
jgi:hypothetical protein